ncbi:hypothetical protein MCEMIE4_03129 [Sphingobium cupriresistens]
MARYVSRPPRGWIEDEVFSEPARLEIIVPLSEATETGLLDADGNSIFRLPNPIGFGRDEEW